MTSATLTKVNKHLAVAFPHVRRCGEYTGHIVVEERLLLLREIADHVTAVVVCFRHNVEEKRLDVIVECLVVEKQLGE